MRKKLLSVFTELYMRHIVASQDILYLQQSQVVTKTPKRGYILASTSRDAR